MIEESCLKGRLSAHSSEAWWKGARCTRAHEDPCWRRLWQGGLLLLLLVAQISYLCNRHTGRNPGGRYDWLRKYPHTGSQYIGRKGWCKMCMHLTMAMPPTCQNVSYIARLYLKNGYRGEGRSLDKNHHYIYPKWLSSFLFPAPSPSSCSVLVDGVSDDLEAGKWTMCFEIVKWVYI